MTTPANPDDMLAFLRACYDERERTAREGIPFGAGHWQAEDSGLIRDSEGGCVVHDDGEQDRATAEHIADNDPAYVLADLAAKRRILDAVSSPYLAYEEEGMANVVLMLLALPHADRPGFREEWRPA